MHEKPPAQGLIPGNQSGTRMAMMMARIFSFQLQLPLSSHNFELEFLTFARRVQRAV